jgi:lia operon protein LiaF
MRPGQIVGPLILIVLGILFLMNNVGWNIPIGYLISRFWPVILIVVGVSQIAGATVGKGSLPGGVIVTTVGVLFLFQSLWRISFGDTWPVLLIAVGAIGLLRAVLGPAMFPHKSMRGGVRR